MLPTNNTQNTIKEMTLLLLVTVSFLNESKYVGFSSLDKSGINSFLIINNFKCELINDELANNQYKALKTTVLNTT